MCTVHLLTSLFKIFMQLGKTKRLSLTEVECFFLESDRFSCKIYDLLKVKSVNRIQNACMVIFTLTFDGLWANH